jgi:hypothetical protein
MEKLAINPSKSNSTIGKLKLVLFAMLAFSCGIGMAQETTTNCPSPHEDGSTLQVVGIGEMSRDDMKNIVVCGYTSGAKKISSLKEYRVVIPKDVNQWEGSGSNFLCTAEKDCSFKVTDADDKPAKLTFTNYPSLPTPCEEQAALKYKQCIAAGSKPESLCRAEQEAYLFSCKHSPKLSSLANERVDLNKTAEVPDEYACNPDQYWAILQKYDQCTKNGGSFMDKVICKNEKSIALSQLALDCALGSH